MSIFDLPKELLDSIFPVDDGDEERLPLSTLVLCISKKYGAYPDAPSLSPDLAISPAKLVDVKNLNKAESWSSSSDAAEEMEQTYHKSHSLGCYAKSATVRYDGARTPATSATLRWLIDQRYIESTNIVEYIVSSAANDPTSEGGWGSIYGYGKRSELVSELSSAASHVLEDDFIEKCLEQQLTSFREDKCENLFSLSSMHRYPLSFEFYDETCIFLDVAQLGAFMATFVLD